MRPVLVALLTAALAGVPAAAAPAAKLGERVFLGTLKRTKHYVRTRGQVVLRVRLFVETSHARYRLVVQGEQPPLPSGSGVRVVGVLHGRTIHARDDGIRQQGIGDPVSRGSGFGTVKIAIVYVDLADDAVHTKPPADVRKVLFDGPGSVAAYFRDVSGGHVNLRGNVHAEGDFFGPYAVPFRKTDGCHHNAWAEAATAKAKEAGVDLAPYDRVMFMMPSVPLCQWAGLAHTPGKWLWVNSGGAAFDSLIDHELGHTFGLAHTGLMRCTDNGVRTSITGTCVRDTRDGGDPFSLMGQGKLRYLVGFQAAHAGFVGAEQVRTPTRGGDFTIVPMESKGTGIKVLHLGRRNNRALDLEFHQPLDRWAPYQPTDRVVQGVTIREAPLPLDRSGGTDTALVDATPETPAYEDATFLPGQTLDDATGGVHVTIGEVTPQGAKVSVRFSHVLDFEAPTDPGNVKATAGKGGPAVITWHPSTDNEGVTGYRVERYTHDGAKREVLGVTTHTTFTDPGATKGWYIYGVQALDAVGNVSRKIETGWLYVHAA